MEIVKKYFMRRKNILRAFLHLGNKRRKESLISFEKIYLRDLS